MSRFLSFVTFATKLLVGVGLGVFLVLIFLLSGILAFHLPGSGFLKQKLVQTTTRSSISSVRAQGNASSSSKVLGFSTSSGSLTVTIPTFFKSLITAAILEVEGDSTLGGNLKVDGNSTFNSIVANGKVTLKDDVTGQDINLDIGSGKLTASNVVYSVTAGSGISVSGTQDIVISATDLGSAQKIFGKVKVGSNTVTAGSNTDTLTFASTGGISATLDSSTNTVTFGATAADFNVSGFIQDGTTVRLMSITDNVGIGTAAPSSKLELNSGIADTAGLTFTQLTSSSAVGPGGGKVLSVDSGGHVILVPDQTGDTPSAETVLPVTSTGGTLYYNGTTWVGSTNLFHDGGKVGISTISPQARFHVYTNDASTKGMIIQGYTNQTANLLELQNSSTTPLAWIDAGGNFSNVGYATHSASLAVGNLSAPAGVGNAVFSGNVGIGTNNPTAALDVNGGGKFTGSGGVTIGSSSITSPSTNNLYISSRLQLGNAGVLGNLAALSIIPVATDRQGLILKNNPGQTADLFQALDSSNNSMFNISAAGKVGIGITSPSAVLDVVNSTITTTNGISGAFNGLTTGTGLALSSTSTALTSGGLATFDWSPGSATTATGDLVSLNVGSNGIIGNIFNVKNGGSSVFSVGQNQIVAALPTAFTAPGDVTFAYDVQFSNPTASFIKSAAPLYLQAGENFGSNDLTLRTFNTGNVIVDSQALVANYAATVSGQLVVGTSVAPANIGNFYLTNSSTFGKALAILNQTETADIFTASASGTTKFVIDSTGKVGVGVAAPTDTVDILGTAVLTGDVDNDTSIIIKRFGSTANIITMGESADAGIATFGYSGFLSSRVQIDGGSGGSQASIKSYNTSGTLTNLFSAGGNSYFNGGNLGIGNTNPSAVLDVVNSTITTTNGISGAFNGLTTGTGLALSSTSTALTSGGIASFDWSPGSATTATGDLVSLNVGANGVIGNIFNVKNNGSSVFSVSQSQITAALPTAFTAPGDMGIAYDLQFTNPTASFIKSAAPLYLQSGEVYNSSDLTLRTFNSGNIVLDAAGGVTLGQAQAWTLATSTSALNISSGLFNIDTTNSRVGIGTTTPGFKLSVTDTQTATVSAMITNSSTGADADGLAIKLGFTGSGTSTNYFETYLDGNGLINGKVQSNGASGVTYATSGVDLAEYFTKEDPKADLPEGTVVCQGVNGVRECTTNDNSRIIGVVSAHPAFLGGVPGPNKVIVALSGQVPVRVTVENGVIKSGDAIAYSGKAGVGSKVTRAGAMVGTALADYTVTDPSQEGMVMVNVKPGYTDAGMTLASASTTNDQVTAKQIQTDSLSIGNLTLEQYINQVVSAGQMATASASPTPSPSPALDPALFATSSAQFASGAAQIRTSLADLNASADDIVLTASDLYLSNYFEAAGNAFVGNNLGVNNGVTVGKGLVLTDLGLDFAEIVPDTDRQLNLLGSGKGRLNILAGKLTLDETGNVTIAGDLNLKGRVTTEDSDAAGFAKINAGDTQVNVTFTRPYAETPIITVTPDDSDTRYSVKNKSVNGFTIMLKSVQTVETTFNWVATHVIGAKTFDSGSATPSGQVSGVSSP